MIDVEYDDQIFNRQRSGGASRLFAELIREFHTTDHGVRPITPFRTTRNEHLAELLPNRYRAVRPGGVLDRRRILDLKSVARASVASSARATVLHPTYYDHRRVRRARRGRPLVTTVLDMMPETLPAHLVSTAAHMGKLELVRESDLVVCISEWTRSQLLATVGALRARVVVVTCGARIVSEDSVRRPRHPDTVLFVGQRGGYKDFTTLLDALALVRCGVRLVCAGGGPFTPEERRAIAGLPRSVSVLQRGVTDTELSELYGTATALVSTSIDEGFGLPALEAMAAGCPVVLTDIPVYRELAGSAASFVPPRDRSALAAALESLLGSEPARRALAEEGWRRAAQFTWERAAAELASAYRALAP